MPLTVKTLINKYVQRNGEAAGRVATTQYERELLDVCALSPEAAMSRLGASDQGLHPPQVEEQRNRFGLNEIARRKKLGFVAEILSRCKNPASIHSG